MAADVVGGILLASITLYAVLGGADFGAGDDEIPVRRTHPPSVGCVGRFRSDIGDRPIPRSILVVALETRIRSILFWRALDS